MGELGGEILTPGSDTTLGGGALQWPLPVAGTITSPQGYRTDPITGETSYHSGTDIAVPEGTPILAAADGTVTIATPSTVGAAVMATTSSSTTAVD